MNQATALRVARQIIGDSASVRRIAERRIGDRWAIYRFGATCNVWQVLRGEEVLGVGDCWTIALLAAAHRIGRSDLNYHSIKKLGKAA